MSAEAKPMYRWRKMTPRQRKEALEHRRRNRFPWHSPPHYVGQSGVYLITAACFEHRPIIGETKERMGAFETELVTTANAFAEQTFAWILLPNHYHMLVHASKIKRLLKA